MNAVGFRVRRNFYNETASRHANFPYDVGFCVLMTVREQYLYIESALGGLSKYSGHKTRR